MQILRRLGLKGPDCFGAFTKGKTVEMNDCFRCSWRSRCMEKEKRAKNLGYISSQLGKN